MYKMLMTHKKFGFIFGYIEHDRNSAQSHVSILLLAEMG